MVEYEIIEQGDTCIPGDNGVPLSIDLIPNPMSSAVRLRPKRSEK